MLLTIINDKKIAKESIDFVSKIGALQDNFTQYLDSMMITQDWMPEETRVITVADREADIYELFALAAEEKSEFLIRAAQNRNTKSGKVCAEVIPLFEAIRQSGGLTRL
ncbi:hypothetical protein VB735_29820 [Halotia wernerae UHCC 0503]|nr:hypothetical protein [Halotia wernerae UHCC 0503]